MHYSRRPCFLSSNAPKDKEKDEGTVEDKGTGAGRLVKTINEKDEKYKSVSISRPVIKRHKKGKEGRAHPHPPSFSLIS